MSDLQGMHELQMGVLGDIVRATAELKSMVAGIAVTVDNTYVCVQQLMAMMAAMELKFAAAAATADTPAVRTDKVLAALAACKGRLAVRAAARACTLRFEPALLPACTRADSALSCVPCRQRSGARLAEIFGDASASAEMQHALKAVHRQVALVAAAVASLTSKLPRLRPVRAVRRALCG
jgi:hypothetical protein